MKLVLDAAVAKFNGSHPHSQCSGNQVNEKTKDPKLKDIPSRVAVTIWSGHDLP